MKPTNNNRAEVEIQYMKRVGVSQNYFEVWVRSAARPDIKRGTIVERGPDERRNVQIAAGALAENLMEIYGEAGQDPDVTARAAGDAYDRLNNLNPIPAVGNENPL